MEPLAISLIQGIDNNQLELQRFTGPPGGFFSIRSYSFKLSDETYMCDNQMDLTLESIDMLDIGSLDDIHSMDKSDSFQYFDNCYSFSVVYRMNDFPFPSINYPSQQYECVDDQLPWDSFCGSSSAFSTPEPLNYAFMGMSSRSCW